MVEVSRNWRPNDVQRVMLKIYQPHFELLVQLSKSHGVSVRMRREGVKKSHPDPRCRSEK
jgi:hypothetical protein